MCDFKTKPHYKVRSTPHHPPSITSIAWYMSSLSDICKKKLYLKWPPSLTCRYSSFRNNWIFLFLNSGGSTSWPYREATNFLQELWAYGRWHHHHIIVMITIIIILARCQHCLCSWRLLCLRLPSRPLQVEAQANVEGAPCMKLNSNQAITFLK